MIGPSSFEEVIHAIDPEAAIRYGSAGCPCAIVSPRALSDERVRTMVQALAFEFGLAHLLKVEG